LVQIQGFSAAQISKIQSQHQQNQQSLPSQNQYQQKGFLPIDNNTKRSLNSQNLVNSYEQYNANNPTINFPGIKNSIQEGFKANPNLSIKNKDSVSYLATLSPQFKKV
jgi:hypothetical protein